MPEAEKTCQIIAEMYVNGINLPDTSPCPEEADVKRPEDLVRDTLSERGKEKFYGQIKDGIIKQAAKSTNLLYPNHLATIWNRATGASAKDIVLDCAAFVDWFAYKTQGKSVNATGQVKEALDRGWEATKKIPEKFFEKLENRLGEK